MARRGIGRRDERREGFVRGSELYWYAVVLLVVAVRYL